MLFSTGHQYRAELAGKAPPSHPRHIKRAIDLMQANPARALTARDLAHAAGSRRAHPARRLPPSSRYPPARFP